jgi:hypothetical protein
VIVATPVLIPVTTPEDDTAAIAVLLVVHIPPVGEPVNVIDEPVQTVLLPVIDAEPLIAIVRVALHPPNV